MNVYMIILYVGLACVVWNVVTTLRVFAELDRRGRKVSFIWLRAMAPVYAHRLRKIMIAETGTSGSLYYQWILSINLALLLAVIALVIYLV